MQISNINRRALLALLAAAPTLASAQAYPVRPVRVIVPFPPGSGTDISARVVADRLAASLGQPFVVENRAGASGVIGAMEVVRAAPDGYTLLFAGTTQLASNVALLKNMPYDPAKNLTPIASVGITTVALMVRPDHPAKKLREFIAYVKQRPGKLSAGYPAASAQVATAMLSKMAGLDVLQVPYKGITNVITDLIGGSLDFAFVDMANAMPQEKGGKLRALGVATQKRHPLTPDWPPIAEVLPGFDLWAWVAVAGPAGMPPALVDRLNAAITAAANSAEARHTLASGGFSPLNLTPAQMKPFIASETKKWIQLAKDANIEPQ
jgi:tripartite-type tricarboxylate transporter receptor subunit TctC